MTFITIDTDTGMLKRAKITRPYGCILMPIETKKLPNTVEMALYVHAVDIRLKQSENRQSVPSRVISKG